MSDPTRPTPDVQATLEAAARRLAARGWLGAARETGAPWFWSYPTAADDVAEWVSLHSPGVLLSTGGGSVEVRVLASGVLRGCPQHRTPTHTTRLPAGEHRALEEFARLLDQVEAKARGLDVDAALLCALLGPCRDHGAAPWDG